MATSPALVPLLVALVLLFALWLFVMYLCLKRVFEQASRDAEISGRGERSFSIDMLMGRDIQPAAESQRSRMMATGV